jgi:hypothetical protein
MVQSFDFLFQAGGTSITSEFMSFEILSMLFNAKLLYTEMELEYMPGSKITDYSVDISGRPIGVSVTRAMKFSGTFTSDDALKLLEKKLKGIIQSTFGVIKRQKWERQILHIWAEKEYIRNAVIDAYHKLSNEIKSNTIIIITTVKNAQWIFFEYSI